jgi:hypothetical protein
MAMPWKLGRAKAEAIRNDATGRMLADLNALFHECFRIQKEASVAVGRHIPMVVENVRGAQRWVGRARWNFGSYYLWGDVPALMPFTGKGVKVGGFSWSDYGKPGYVKRAFNGEATNLPGFRFDGSGRSFQTASVEGTKFTIPRPGQVNRETRDRVASTASNSSARKAASAMIAKIPLPLARHIASIYRVSP